MLLCSIHLNCVFPQVLPLAHIYLKYATRLLLKSRYKHSHKYKCPHNRNRETDRDREREREWQIHAFDSGVNQLVAKLLWTINSQYVWRYIKYTTQYRNRGKWIRPASQMKNYKANKRMKKQRYVWKKRQQPFHFKVTTNEIETTGDVDWVHKCIHILKVIRRQVIE